VAPIAQLASPGVVPYATVTPEELAAAWSFIMCRRTVSHKGLIEVRVEQGRPDLFFRVSKNAMNDPKDQPPSLDEAARIAAFFIVR
jgi:hypothetical protein